MITAIVLAKNESTNLARCLKSISWCDKILVINDSSVDDTAAIAKKNSAQVLNYPVGNDFAAARNWAMSQVKSGWILFVDADEVVTSDLAHEITQIVNKNSSILGYYIHRVDIMWGHPLLHGDVANVYLLRLAKTGNGKWVNPVHETWQNISSTAKLGSVLLHYPHPTIAEFLQHVNYYSTLKARQLHNLHKSITPIYMIATPVTRFIKNYFFRLGFLDGTAGFIHAMMMSFYAYLVVSKTLLLRRHDKTSA